MGFTKRILSIFGNLSFLAKHGADGDIRKSAKKELNKLKKENPGVGKVYEKTQAEARKARDAMLER